MASLLKRTSAAAAVAVAALALNPAPAQAAAGNYVYNAGSIGIGIMHLLDHNYTNGHYDQILQPGRRSNQDYPWSFTQGFWIGSGYCASLVLSDAEGSYPQTNPVRGPIEMAVLTEFNYSVKPYRC